MQQDAGDLLQKIYYMYQVPLKLIARKLNVPEKDVDDLVQDTFLSYYTHYPLDLTEAHIKSILVSTIHNKCVDYHRKRRREDLIYDTEEFAVVREEKLQYSCDFLQSAICEEIYCEVEALIKDMKTETANMVSMFINEVPDRVIAEQLDIPLLACRARISRARKKLKKELGPKLT